MIRCGQLIPNRNVFSCRLNSLWVTSCCSWDCTNKSSHRPHISAKENLVWIQSPYLDPKSRSRLPLKFNGNFLVKGYICDKFSRISDHFIRKCKPNCGKCPGSHCWKILRKNPGYRSGGGSLPKCKQFFHNHRYICGKIFVKIRSVVFTWSC